MVKNAVKLVTINFCGNYNRESNYSHLSEIPLLLPYQQEFTHHPHVR